MARLGAAGKASLGGVWRVKVWLSVARQARQGAARSGEARRGKARQAWQGAFWHGMSRLGMARQAWPVNQLE